ncbi:MAG: TldD/PmbA family protein [Candidatus Eisenbacteria bacterium]|nr:TldD/PmbA family protein [Candidatus Eisenbacteria bacterium]
MRDLLAEITRDARHWTELRMHDRRSLAVTVRKGVVESASSHRVSGVGVRVLVDGAWGFSATSSLDRAGIQEAVRAAETAAARSSAAKLQRVKSPAECELAVGDFRTADARDVAARSTEEKTALVVDTERRIRNSSPLICSAMCRYTEIMDDKWISTSDGADAHVEDSKLEFLASGVAEKDGERTIGWKGNGVTGGWSDLFEQWTPERVADHAARTAVDLLSAPYAPGGARQVILNPELVALLAHEAIGHTVEADFVLSGSAASGKLGEKVASELVTLVDSGPVTIGKPTAGGVVLVDDEGVPAGRTVIIERGVLKSYLHDRETAARFGVTPTGNARAWQYDDEPMIRMRNTYIEPGEDSLDDMIASVDDGLLLEGASSGQADANAEFMFGVQEAYEIRNGKIGRLLRGASISGDAFRVLSGVDMVGTDFEWAIGSGYCGKGQPAKVDGGGAHVRCHVVVGGR